MTLAWLISELTYEVRSRNQRFGRANDFGEVSKSFRSRWLGKRYFENTTSKRRCVVRHNSMARFVDRKNALCLSLGSWVANKWGPWVNLGDLSFRDTPGRLPQLRR